MSVLEEPCSSWRKTGGGSKDGETPSITVYTVTFASLFGETPDLGILFSGGTSLEPSTVLTEPYRTVVRRAGAPALMNEEGVPSGDRISRQEHACMLLLAFLRCECGTPLSKYVTADKFTRRAIHDTFQPKAAPEQGGARLAGPIAVRCGELAGCWLAESASKVS